MQTRTLAQHLEKLPHLVVVGRLGSLTKAARVLAMSQAALSQSIKGLESALDVQLFLRSRKGVVLTEEGNVLFRYAEQMVDELPLLEAKLRNPTKLQTQRIRVGTHEALAVHVWPNIVERFQRKHPQCLLSIVSGRIESLKHQLLEGRLDLIVTVTPDSIDGVCTEELYSDTFEFYGPDKNRVSLGSVQVTGSEVSLEQLNEIPILTDSHAHLAQGRSLLRELSELGLHSANYFQLNSFEAASMLAAKGLGIALLPRKIGEVLPKTAYRLRRYKIKGLAVDSFRHSICCSYRRQSKNEEVPSLLLKALKDWLGK